MKVQHKFDADNLFFTADNHLCHENIITYCNRPFKDAHHMNEVLIKNWNEVVPEDADVIIGGDFIHTGQIDSVRRIVNSLNGRKSLIYGNHDFQNRLDRPIFEDLFELRADVVNILVNDPEYKSPINIFVSHYPHLYWPRGCYHIHGHIHSGPASTSSEKAPFHPLRYDIGCDNNLHKPIPYKHLMNIFKNQLNKTNG